MADRSLKIRTLESLALCRSIAQDNLNYYEGIFDAINGGADRDLIGRAMAQKQDFISAVDVILKKHKNTEAQIHIGVVANDRKDIIDERHLADIRQLEHEELFEEALAKCLAETDDEALSELLSHHLTAAHLAVSAIKSSSLKL